MRHLAVALAVVLTACSSKSPAGPRQGGAFGGDGQTSGSGGSGATAAQTLENCSPDLASLTTDLFGPSCATAGCHSGAMAAATLDLGASDLAAHLIGLPAGTCDGWLLVSPGKPDESLLVAKLEGKVPADCGDPMPPASDPISAKGIACVRDWIASLSADAAVTGVIGCETCGGADCVDVATDALHCGSCTTPCPSGASCSNGQCECPSGLTLCGGRCVDVTSDAEHCGACAKPCASGELCSAGACECGPGLATCMSGCAELATDPTNCGGCETKCGPGKLCTPTGCGTQANCVGLTRCGSACVDTDTSLMHCGGCNMPCAPGEGCVNGSCACPAGAASCGGTCVDTSTDSTHCGSCSNVCPDGTSCKSGACECPGGGAACGGGCVELSADPLNCGSCGNVCAPGQACSAGQCSCSSRTVSFANDVAPVLNRNCTNAGCHSGTKAKASLDLTLSKSYAELVGVKTTQCTDNRLLVGPGAPSTSYLIQKLLGVNMCSGTQMPKAGTTLPAADLEAITAWICQGAPK